MNPRARAGLAILAGYLLTALLGPGLVPLDPAPHYELRFLPPQAGHWLGTDYAGRDILVQLIHGSRDIMAIAFLTALLATLAAFLIGVGGGLAGGRSDQAAGLVADLFLTVPTFPVMAILAALFRVENALGFALVLALFSWPGLARALRAQVLTLKQREFVEVARLMTMGRGHILFREILPNLVPLLALHFIQLCRGAITASVGIMLLGLVPLKVENWGMMLNLAAFQSGAIFLPQATSYVLSPLLAIVGFQVALIWFSSGLEEWLDPRLR